VVFRDELPTSSPIPNTITAEAYAKATSSKLSINRERLAWLTRHVLIRPGSVVDIGTKDGSALRVLSEAGWHATGYDPDTRFHEFAQQTYGVEIRPQLFTNETVESGTLDLVTAFHVLEHARDPLSFLSSVRETLRPDGFLFLELPNLRHIQARQLNRGHVVLYSAHTLSQALKACGFSVRCVTEYAPGGNRTYDQLAIVAQRGEPEIVEWRQSEVDRLVPRYFLGTTLEPEPSTVLPTRIYRGLKRRARCAFRRARYSKPSRSPRC
jgi:SAM-dependent methyltransferase